MAVVMTTSPDETRAVGRRLAGLLRAGDVVLLAGRLGSGKTVFVSGIADGLGVEDRITSPTFVLVHEHDGFLPLFHADVYRLGSSAEFEDLELPTTAQDGVLVVEWGTAIEGAVPDDHLVVEITMIGDEERRIAFEPVGSWSSRSLEEVTA